MVNSPENVISDPLYKEKFINIPRIIADWAADHGGIAGKDILEFGCGEGTLALGLALRSGAQRVVGVDVLPVFDNCLELAHQQFNLGQLPPNLHFRKIAPGDPITVWGEFDVVVSWSVFEHVRYDVVEGAIASIFSVLKPGGLLFLQISPLYYSAFGSHLSPWIPAPWAHLQMQLDHFQSALFDAPETPLKVRNEWSVYIPMDADRQTERSALWDTFAELNRITAPELVEMLGGAGFEILRDYRTRNEVPVPHRLSNIYDPDVLTTEQVVLLARKPA